MHNPRIRRRSRAARITPLVASAVVVALCAAGLTACAPPTTGPADRRITVAVDGAPSARVSAGTLDAAALAGLHDVTELGAIVGVPTAIELDTEIPAAGVELTRVYADAVPKSAAASFMFFNEELAAWQAVPSELSADRRTLTATVHHLSLWNDVVAGGKKALQAVSGAAELAGQKVTDAGAELTKSLAEVNKGIGTLFANGADALYYGVGKIFDTRVDDPDCHNATPQWVDSAEFIAYNANNPILFCAGRDEKDPSLLVVKARVNRGFGFTVTTAAQPTWSYNSTGDQSAVDALLSLAGSADEVVRQGIEELYSAGDLVGAGQEISYGFARGAASAVPVGSPLVALAPPTVAVFVRSSIEQAIVSWGVGKAEGAVAATIVVAACLKEIRDADDGYDGVKAALACLSKADTLIAQSIALALLKLGRSPKAAGQLAGQLVGKASLALAVVAPATSILNYIAELGLPDSARTVTVFTNTPTTPGDVSDWVVGFGTLGPLTAGMSMSEMAGVMGVPMVGNQWGAGMDDFDGYCAQGSLTTTGTAANIGFLSESGGSYGPVDRFFIDAYQADPADLPRTAAGTGVGSAEAAVTAEFGSTVTQEPNPYAEGGKMLTALGPGGTGIVFITDETATVTAVVTGKVPQVYYPEGCL